MKRNKLFALLLALCLMLPLLPTVAMAEEVEDELTATDFAATSTTYMTFSGVKKTSDAVYAGYSAKSSEGYIQLNSKNNYGIVTTASGGKVTSVTITVGKGSNTLEIYGSNTPYTSAAELYQASTQGTKIGSLSATGTVTVSGDYAYIGFRSGKNAIYLSSIHVTWETEGSEPKTYSVSFDAGEGGTGVMEGETGVTSPYTLPECTFTAPDGYEFAGWLMSGGAIYQAGASVVLTADATFIAQWSKIPTYTDMVRRETIADGDEIVIYNPDGGVVMTAEGYLYNNKKNELVPALATLTDGVLAVPDTAMILTVVVNADGTYSFKNADGKYLYVDSSDVKLVDATGENTLFVLEDAENGSYIRCNTANYSGKAQYLQYYHDYFTVYGLDETNAGRYVMQFYAKPEAAEATFTTHSLLLSSEIGVHFKVEVDPDADVEGWYMTFSYSDGRADASQTIADAIKVNDTTYRFTAYINALELADTVTATLHCGDRTVEDSYSATTYFAAAREKLAGNAKLMALIDALQDYGYCLSQSGWTDSLTHEPIASANTAVDIETAKTGVKDMAAVKELENSGVQEATISLTLNSKTKLNVKATLQDGVTIAAPEGTYTVSDGKYVFETRNIGPRSLAKVYTVKIETSAGTATVKASPMSYVNAVLNSAKMTEAQQLAMAAYYNYYLAAAAY